MITRILCLLSLLFCGGCVRLPEDIEPVKNFELERYLGTWYEIARLDHSFERGLNRVSANYSLRDDGGINVLNKGYLQEKDIWKQASGKAYFAKGSSDGFLKVSFFGPFYGSYIIFELDKEQYQYALVCGPDKSYLWILSRSPQMEESLKNKLIEKAKLAGFATDKLIFVEQVQ